MKSIITAVLTCSILFGISLTTTKLLYERAPQEASNDSQTASKSAEQDAEQTSPQKATAMPVSFRPDNAVSIEAVLQMSDSIKKMEQQLIEREQRLIKDEQRVKLLLDDLLTEQNELRAFSEGIDAKVESLQQMASEFRKTLKEMESRKIELEQLEKKTGSDDESKQQELDGKVNDVKSWFANLEPEQSADYLKEFANNGKLEFAASLLQKMPDRQKSKILGVMSDPVLVEQLIDSLEIRPKQ